MAAPDVLHQGMPGDDHPGAAVLLEPTHRPQARLQPAVVTLDAVICVPVAAVPRRWQQLLQHRRVHRRLIGSDLDRRDLGHADGSLEEPAGGVALLRRESGDDPSRSLVWSQLLAAHGVGDVASLVLRDRFGCWGFLDLWRCGPAARFHADEEDFLADIVEPVTTALRRSQAATFHVDAPRPTRPGPVVLLLTRELDVLAQTPPTEALLRVLIPPGHDAGPVPAGAYNVAAQLLAGDAGVT